MGEQPAYGRGGGGAVTSLSWRIYYRHRVFDSAQGTHLEAPATGVQAIVIKDTDVPESNVGHFILQRKDYYWHEDGEWCGGDIFGMFDFLMRSGVVKFGRSIPNSEYREILSRAGSDPDFPRKSGYRPNEIKPRARDHKC